MSATPSPTLELQTVSLRRGSHTVLDAVSLVLPFGEHLAVIGPNGSGKSSLLHLMAGRFPPDAGTVLLAGQPLASMPLMQRAQQIAMVHQKEQIHAFLSVRDYVALGRTPFAMAHRDENQLQVQQALERCALLGLQNRRISALSGGEQQRACIARALAQSPQLLLLDEPTNHLDMRTRADLLDMVTDIGITVVAALHELSLVHRFAHRVLMLQQGRVVTLDVPQNALRQKNVFGTFGMDVHYVDIPGRSAQTAVFEPPLAVPVCHCGPDPQSMDPGSTPG